MKAPHQDHFDAALQTVRYLKGTPAHSIMFQSDASLQITLIAFGKHVLSHEDHLALI